MSIPNFDAWRASAERLGLWRRGAELIGPCPRCGGVDRFHVRPDAAGRALVGCRGCIDGRVDARSAFGELLRAAFGTSAPTPRAAPRYERARRNSTLSTARRFWQQSISATNTPAHAYLSERHAWAPPGADPPLPDDVRWLPELRVDRQDGETLSAIVFGWRGADHQLRAVSVDALDAHGRLRAARWRRTFGSRSGATFCAARGRSVIVLVEGEVSALAACWRYADADVLALGGTSGMKAWRPRAGETRQIIVEADGDLAGDTAARAVAASTGASVRVRASGDIADELADQMAERLAIMAADAGLARQDVAAAAWAAQLNDRQRC